VFAVTNSTFSAFLISRCLFGRELQLVFSLTGIAGVRIWEVGMAKPKGWWTTGWWVCGLNYRPIKFVAENLFTDAQLLTTVYVHITFVVLRTVVCHPSNCIHIIISGQDRLQNISGARLFTPR